MWRHSLPPPSECYLTHMSAIEKIRNQTIYVIYSQCKYASSGLTQKLDMPQPTGWPASSTSVAVVAETNEVLLIFGTGIPPYLQSLKTQTAGRSKQDEESFSDLRACVWSASLEQTELVQSRLEGAYASLFLINIKSSSPGGPDEKTPRVSLGLPFGARYPRNILTLEKKEKKKKTEAHTAWGLHGLPKCPQKF